MRANLGLAQQTFAAQQGAHAGHPAPPGQLGDDHRNQRHHRRQRHEEVEDITLGFFAAARDKTHVMHQDQLARRCGLAHHRLYRDVQGALGTLQQVVSRLFPAGQIGAANFLRHRSADQGRDLVRGAVANRVQSLILCNAGEKCTDLGLLASGQLFLQRLLDRVGDQFCAYIHIAHKPFEGQLIDQWGHGIGNARQCQQQRKNEAQRKSHVLVLFV